MLRWQPIRTAPKDGTPILLWVKGRAIEGRWDIDEFRADDEPEGQWAYRWAESDSYGLALEEPPTHWAQIVTPDQEQCTVSFKIAG